MVQDIPLTESVPGIASHSGGNFDINAALQNALAQVGSDPGHAVWWLFLHGGWIVVVILALFAFRALWLDSLQGKAAKKKRWILLAIDVPRESLQTVKAVDNMFAHIAGAHSTSSFAEKWFEGKVQDPLSAEIISIEGHLQYLIHCLDKMQDLIEGALYAQYPDAEIALVDDYTIKVPQKYPDETYECFGTELIPVKSDVYPLKTYMDFEHQMTGEFKDPLAGLLESFSRLGPGEQAWYQIVMTPISQGDFIKKSHAEIMALKGEKGPQKPTIADKIADAPLAILRTASDVVFGGAEDGKNKKKDDNPFSGKMMMLTPGERNRFEMIEKKASKIQFLCKIRFMYIAKKEVFSKAKILYSFIGAIKQFNTNDLQALKPEGDKIGVNSTLLFMKAYRNNLRKNNLMAGYRRRSDWIGYKKYHMGTDELASLWHLPVVKEVKAPQLKKTEAKKIEPPMNLPFAG
jgi:hypothetical protein